MKFSNNTPCPICKIGTSRDIGNYKDMLYGHLGEWKLLRCNHCKHESVYPPLSSKELESIYNLDTYYSFRTSKMNTISTFLRSKTRRMFPKNLKGKKILDYGCGDGEVLCLAKLAGAQVYGIEFGDTPEQLSKDLGLDIKSYPPSSWIGNMDYVRSFHSYEHITDPIEVLEQFKSLVTPVSGRILIGVPNVDSWTASIFGKYYFYRGVPLHLHGYTPSSIRYLANICDLEVVSLKTPGGFRGILGSIHLSLQGLTAKKSIEPSNKTLMLLLPLYLLILPIVLIGNFFLKGDVLEVELRNPNV